MEAAIAAQLSLTQQAVAIEMLKMAQQQALSLVSMIAESVESVPISSERGLELDLSV